MYQLPVVLNLEKVDEGEGKDNKQGEVVKNSQVPIQMTIWPQSINSNTNIYIYYIYGDGTINSIFFDKNMVWCNTVSSNYYPPLCQIYHYFCSGKFSLAKQILTCNSTATK